MYQWITTMWAHYFIQLLFCLEHLLTFETLFGYFFNKRRRKKLSSSFMLPLHFFRVLIARLMHFFFKPFLFLYFLILFLLNFIRVYDVYLCVHCNSHRCDICHFIHVNTFLADVVVIHRRNGKIIQYADNLYTMIY